MFHALGDTVIMPITKKNMLFAFAKIRIFFKTTNALIENFAFQNITYWFLISVSQIRGGGANFPIKMHYRLCFLRIFTPSFPRRREPPNEETRKT